MTVTNTQLNPTNYDDLNPREAVMGGVALYNKLKLALRYYLLAMVKVDKRWKLVYDAFEFLLRRELNADGTLAMRKNGKDPLLLHAIQQASWVRLYGDLLGDPLMYMAAALLHDELEDDPNLTIADLTRMFGPELTEICRRFSKKYGNTRVPDDQYYAEIGTCPVTTFGKALDNLNNITSMEGVHSLEKQRQLITRITQHVLPMLKVARVRFVEQEAAFELVKVQLVIAVRLLNYKIEAQEENAQLKLQLETMRQQLAAQQTPQS